MLLREPLLSQGRGDPNANGPMVYYLVCSRSFGPQFDKNVISRVGRTKLDFIHLADSRDHAQPAKILHDTTPKLDQHGPYRVCIFAVISGNE